MQSIQAAPTTRAQRQRRPSPETILLIYHQEVNEGGQRGAYRRAAERLGVSPDTVERTVHRDEARRAAQEEAAAAELAYVPPDPDYEAERPRLAAELIASLTEVAAETPRAPEPEIGEVMSIPEPNLTEDATPEPEAAAESPEDDAAECRTDEPERLPARSSMVAAFLERRGQVEGLMTWARQHELLGPGAVLGFFLAWLLIVLAF